MYNVYIHDKNVREQIWIMPILPSPSYAIVDTYAAVRKTHLASIRETIQHKCLFTKQMNGAVWWRSQHQLSFNQSQSTHWAIKPISASLFSNK